MDKRIVRAMRSRRACAFLSILVIIITSSAARGQTRSDDTTLAEIVITAQRVTENQQRVPIAVTALSAEQLISQGVNNITDLQTVVPSLSISQIGISTSINIRGVGTLQSSPADSPGVAVYIDGALIPHETTLLGSFYDISSVEVLRGPQGTLTGQNSTGGAMYLRSQAPVLDKFSGYIDQTFGNFTWSRTVGALNIPMGQMFALRIAAVDDVRHSFTVNTGGHSQPGNLDYEGIRANLLFQPSDRFSANLRYEWGYSNNNNIAYFPFYSLPTSHPFVISQNANTYKRDTTNRADAEFHFHITPTLELREISSYQSPNQSYQADVDESAPPLPQGGISLISDRYHTWVHEINLISTAPGALRWVIGGFYSKEKSDTQLLAYFSPVDPIGPPFGDSVTDFSSHSESIFGQVTYKFLPQWELVAGARYSRDHQSEDRVRGFFGGFGGTSTADSSSPTGKVALSWLPSDDSLFYVSVAKGYKAGGNNVQAIDPPFVPEKNVVEELGSKTEFLDNHLRLNTAVFYSQYKSIQVQAGETIFFPFPQLVPITQNTGDANSYGGEVEFTGVFGGLAFNSALAYLHSRTTADVQLLNSVTGLPTTVPSGTVLPYAPEWTGNAGLQYAFATAYGALTPRVQVTYLSSQQATFFAGVESAISSRALLDLKLTYVWDPSLLIEAFATNILDKDYVAGVGSDSGPVRFGQIYGAPRQYGMRFKYSWK